MRVLVVATPSAGHVFPMVPLAWALRAAGHDVLVATAGKALAVERAGLAVADVAPGEDTGSIMKQVLPDLFAKFQQARDLAERGERPAGPRPQMTSLLDAAAMFGPVSGFIADAVVDVATAWRPDLVVSSQIDAAGMVAAGRLGIPLVSHGFGIARSHGVPERYRDQLADVFKRHGVATPPLPSASIDIAPASMTGGDVQGWPMRNVPYNGSGRLPSWLWTGSDLPRVAVTLGTVVPDMKGVGVVGRIIAAAADLDVELVLALGDDVDTSAFGHVPANVRLAGWLPLNALLPSCAAIVHHGGSGTTHAALDAGVPQLVLPTGGDSVITAKAVGDRGVGLWAESGGVDADLLDRVVRDPAFRATAAEVMAEMHAMPTPASLVPSLTALVEV